MNALFALVATIVIVMLGYRFYASRVNQTIIQADPKRATPATMFNDGVDFMPASVSAAAHPASMRQRHLKPSGALRLI